MTKSTGGFATDLTKGDVEIGSAIYDVWIEDGMVSPIGNAGSQLGAVVRTMGDDPILTSRGQLITQDGGA